VEPSPIIEDFNVVGNILFGFVPCRINGAVHPLILQDRKKGFGQRIIVTAPGAAQGLPHVQCSEFQTEFG
jgi:hypothetical protein